MARRPRQPTAEERALWAKVAATVDPLRKPDLPSKPDRTPGAVATTAVPTPPGGSPETLLEARASGPKPAPGTAPKGSAKTAAKTKGKVKAGKAPQPPASVYTPPVGLQPPRRSGVPLFGEMDRRSHDKLRRGRFVIDSRLDLHGMTQAQAHSALRAFVLDNHRRGRRKLLVITGKGGGGLKDPLARPTGVLRGRLKQWLLEPDLRPLVLGLEPARPDHGGAGAFYLLLRRIREG